MNIPIPRNITLYSFHVRLVVTWPEVMVGGGASGLVQYSMVIVSCLRYI